jgi:hypothetical protein
MNLRVMLNADDDYQDTMATRVKLSLLVEFFDLALNRTFATAQRVAAHTALADAPRPATAQSIPNASSCD